VTSVITPALRILLALFALAAAAFADSAVTTRTDEIGRQLNEWFTHGTAAGLQAITYENRDGGHSQLDTAQWPQLQVYPPAGTDKGAAHEIRPQPTLGNCSMASAATQLGCLPRLYMMDPAGNRFLAQQYFSNNLFIYPEHEDYDIGANGVGGYGDLLPLNTPALITTQGSSFSDLPFLRALLSAAAALPPDTQKQIIKQRLLAPVLQSIFRRAGKNVRTSEDYFTGAAHPVVFDAAQIDEAKMIRLAHEMTPDKIPPVPILRVVEETPIEPGKNSFEAAGTWPWQLADTPISIARVLRGNAAEHRLLVSFDKTANPTKNPLTIRIQLLQGDARFVRIEREEGKSLIRLRVRWAPPVIAATGIRSHRIDIGVFADNGSVSAPAIISFYMLPNEMHFFDEKGRVSEIHYQTHNPDFGLPRSTTDPRWLEILRVFTTRDTSLRSRLLEQILQPPEQAALLRCYTALKPQSSAPAGSDGKDAASRLGAQISEALQQRIGDATNATIRSVIEKVLHTIAGSHLLYFGLQRELDNLAAHSSKPSAVADVRAELYRLIMQGVLIEQASGQIDTMSPPDKLSLGERYMLRGLNLTLLSQVIFPGILERSTVPAYVSPRLTTPKQWRDVYRYDPDSGKLLGWIRHAGGRIANFDADGRLQPDGPDGKSVPVIYLKNDNGTLDWQPQSEPALISPQAK